MEMPKRTRLDFATLAQQLMPYFLTATVDSPPTQTDHFTSLNLTQPSSRPWRTAQQDLQTHATQPSGHL